MDRNEIEGEVRVILGLRGKLPIEISTLAATDCLFDAGMTSHPTVKVMLGLEDRFEIEFPDELLERSVFGQFATISNAIEKLLAND